MTKMRCFVHAIFFTILPAVIAKNRHLVKLQKPVAFEKWHRRCSHRNQQPRACFNSLDIRGGAELDDAISGAYDWTVNLGAPAALVAGETILMLYAVFQTKMYIHIYLPPHCSSILLSQ